YIALTLYERGRIELPPRNCMPFHREDAPILVAEGPGGGRLADDDAHRLDEQGYLMLRGAIPAEWLVPLREAFEAGALPSAQWPVPRGLDWRHAMVDLDTT